MDANAAEERRQGGTVEPVKRATVAKEFFQMPADKPSKTYELRDPFAEVTYRSGDRAAIEAKANELGATRFHERDDDGRRTAISKVNGRWERSAAEQEKVQTSAEPASKAGRTASQDTPRTGTDKVVPLTSATRHPEPSPNASSRTVQSSSQEQPSPPRDRMHRVEVETARAARVEQLESALHDRYVIKRPPLAVRTVGLGQTEYRFRGDTGRVAFTESMLKLSTDNNNPSVARSMVDVAETRKWGSLKVSGNDEFKRLVWLEASVRGIKTVGYEPHRADIEVLNKEMEARRANRIEPMRSPDHAKSALSGPSTSSTARTATVPSTTAPAATSTAKQSARGSGGRKSVLAALEAVLVERKVPEKRREAVMAAAEEQLARRTKAGEVHRIKILDKDAPAQRMAPNMQPKVSRQRERAGPTR